MGSHPLNLTLRFLLEVGVLVAAAMAGWQLLDGVGRWLGAVGLPVLLASMWGVFAVTDDPSRGAAARGDSPGMGKAPPVPVSGAVRLVVETVYFAAGVGALWLIGFEVGAMVFGVVVVIHYALSWDRISWLLAQSR